MCLCALHLGSRSRSRVRRDRSGGHRTHSSTLALWAIPRVVSAWYAQDTSCALSLTWFWRPGDIRCSDPPSPRRRGTGGLTCARVCSLWRLLWWSVVTADTHVYCSLDPPQLPVLPGILQVPLLSLILRSSSTCTRFSILGFRLHCQLASCSFGGPPMVPLGVSSAQEPFTWREC